jgi:hypothetical protein
MSNPYAATVEDAPMDDAEVPIPSSESLNTPLTAGPLPADEEQIQPADGRISIKVCDNQGSDVTFKVKLNTKLGKLMKVYSEKIGKSPGSIRFLLEGSRITPEDTPASVRARCLPKSLLLPKIHS